MRETRASPARFLRIALVLLLTGIILRSYLIGETPDPSSVQFVDAGSHHVEGVVVRQERGNTQKLTLDRLVVDGEALEDRVLIFSSIYPIFEYGDYVRLRCELERPQPFDGFRYDRYLASKDIYQICFTRSSPVLVAHDQGSPVIAILRDVRQRMLMRIDRVFGEPQASLLAGLLLGEQRFSDRWEERFQRSGTSHVVAASGYNISVVVFIFSGMFVRAGIKRQTAFWFLLQAVFGYVILAGAEAAVIRAGVMACLILLARQIGRRANLTNAILLTAAIMLAINPSLLRDDVGFQLSFASTIALVYLAPTIQKRCAFIPETYGLRESFAATLAATVLTLPIALLTFGEISLIALVSNVLILPLVPYAMLFGSVALIGSLFAGPAWLLLSLMLVTIRSLASLPFASVSL